MCVRFLGRGVWRVCETDLSLVFGLLDPEVVRVGEITEPFIGEVSGARLFE